MTEEQQEFEEEIALDFKIKSGTKLSAFWLFWYQRIGKQIVLGHVKAYQKLSPYIRITWTKIGVFLAVSSAVLFLAGTAWDYMYYRNISWMTPIDIIISLVYVLLAFIYTYHYKNYKNNFCSVVFAGAVRQTIYPSRMTFDVVQGGYQGPTSINFIAWPWAVFTLWGNIVSVFGNRFNPFDVAFFFFFFLGLMPHAFFNYVEMEPSKLPTKESIKNSFRIFKPEPLLPARVSS